MTHRILIIDDEPDMLVLLRRIFSEAGGFDPVTADDPVAALQLVRESDFDLVLSDLKMPRMDGIRLLEQIKQLRPKMAVIILTAYGTIETAVEATRKGAFDYITKPFRRERILLTVTKALKWQEMVQENIALRHALAAKEISASLVGSSPAMLGILQRIRQVAPTAATVLITGPSGTGKELVARAIHQHSQRAGSKMVTINCAAVPQEVIESELFGHVKGAFTGAWKEKKGLVEEAHAGTLFLDEIGDLSAPMQTKLLRLLQEGEYRPVGSVVTRKADLRFIAATNQDLDRAIREKRFREDLFYRLNVIRFDLPPLAARREDIALLGMHFLRKYAAIYQKDISDISAEALDMLQRYDFPGNVRELENIIERGVIFCPSKTLSPEELQLPEAHGHQLGMTAASADLMPFREAKDRAIEDFHRQYIQRLLRRNQGNISRAAEAAGIQRQYLHRLIKDAGVETIEFKSTPDESDNC